MKKPRQMLLDLGAEKPQTLDNFVTGSNAELMQLLLQVASRSNIGLDQSFIYLWGNPGAGKTHLLQALADFPGARYIKANEALMDRDDGQSDGNQDPFLFTPEIDLYLLDDCDKLSEEAQIAAFALFNQVRENNAMLVSAGSVAPAGLTVREDLRTRLGWGLIYQVHELTDEEKIAALNHAAQVRGISLSTGVLPYLLTHFKRDMRSLSAMLDALDHYSLETQRPITLPLLRDLLQLEKESVPQ